jgi:alkyl hydroperoxide reductase subunit F
MYDLIVIGGGPAGLVATIYAIRKRLNVLLVSRDLGGKTNYHLALPWIEDYQVIRGLEIVSKFKSELEYLDFARHLEAVEKVEKVEDHFEVHTRGGGELQSRAVIIATGSKQKLLGVPGEKEFMMKGLCYSALSYAPIFIDRHVVVVGNEELALRSAAELATVAKHVDLVCDQGKLPESQLSHKLIDATNVNVLFNYRVLEVKGDNYARSITLETTDGKMREINFDGCFIEMALIPNSQMVADLVKLDRSGRIIVNCSNHTSVPGLFAAGDVTNTFAEQVLVSVGEGAKASLSAYEFLLPQL